MIPTSQSLLETDLLRTFVAISDTGSFTSAAKTVFRTPSAVSMQMKRLEEQLGRPLFEKQGRNVGLTPDGEALLGYSRQMLKLNEEAVSRFRAPPLAGVVRFGAPDDFGTRFLPRILARFASSHPQVDVEVTLAPSLELRAKLGEDQLDLTLVTTEPHEDGVLSATTVLTEPLVWAGIKGGQAKLMDPLPLALAGRGCCWRASALKSLDRKGMNYRVVYTSENCQGQLAALAADLAIAPLPLSLLTAPYERIEHVNLPDMGDYRIRLLENVDMGDVARAFAGHVIESFKGS